MKVDLGISCRGTGSCYIELLVSENKSDRIVVSAHTLEGKWIPLQQHDSDVLLNGKRQIVCLVPFWEVPNFELVCQEIDAQGQCVDVCTKHLSYAWIKWASRYNYRLKKIRTQQVRNVCDRTDYRYMNIVPAYYLVNASWSLSNGSEHILKATIQLPYDDESIHLRILDGHGNLLHERIILSDAFYEIYPKELWGQRIFEVAFSERIPDDGKTYCIVAQTEKSNLMGFLNIDPDSRGYLSSVYNHRFYKIAQNDNYRKARASGRLGSQPTSLIEQPHLDVGLFSVVVPLFNTPLDFLCEMVESVQKQVYSNWELVLVNASPENEELAQALVTFDDDRIRIVSLLENKGIAENTNEGIRATTGDFIFLLDHDDFLDPWALYEYARALADDPTIDMLYCDEDFFDAARGFVDPHFKSDFNIDLLRCHNYITHFLGMRASLMKELLLDSTYDSAQDYDLILRAAEKTTAIKHVPHVLYHWRIHDHSAGKNYDAKPEANEHGRLALQAHLDRCGLKAHAELMGIPYIYHVTYEIEGAPLVSILVPNKDNPEVLRRCIESIEQKSTYKNYEIVIIENNSVEKGTFELYDQLERDYAKVKVITWKHEFNYSKINNYGVQFTQGEYLLLLNNDTEVIAPDWIESMLSVCQRSDVGIVGAKLLFPDDTIQHAGVGIMYCEEAYEMAVPRHMFYNYDKDDQGYMFRASLKQDMCAVTGACLMTTRDLYNELGGLDEAFVVAYNDIDFCLRAREKGFLVVYNPDALLYHHESLTRGLETSTAKANKYEHFLSEQGLLRNRWSRYFAQGDPYFGKYFLMSIPKSDWE